ncbi:unnamed protein product [Brassica napus]|uniref:(rape) hypothetical protein n=1 Tax=Brassica napus TaxID=3708 RepID=A0A816MP36_BRANA|nr:unnamed protein product [Brassica napus]
MKTSEKSGRWWRRPSFDHRAAASPTKDHRPEQQLNLHKQCHIHHIPDLIRANSWLLDMENEEEYRESTDEDEIVIIREAPSQALIPNQDHVSTMEL